MSPVNHTKTAAALSLIITTVGALVLLGWQFEIDFLKRPIPGLVAMNPVTALCFILSGVAIYFAAKATDKNNLSLISKIAAAIVVFIGAFKLLDFIFDLQTGFEHWLFSTKILSDNVAGIMSRVAPATAINFVLLGSAVLLSHSRKQISKAIVNFLALFIFLVGLFSTLGYLYYVPEFKEILSAHPMAVHTAICFLLSALAILFLNHDKSFMLTLTHPKAGSLVARMLIPATVVVPFLLGFLVLQLLRNYTISTEFSVALLISFIVLIFFFITWYVSVELNKINIGRDAAETELVKANTQLKLSQELFLKFFKASPVATNIVTIKDGRLVHVNNAFLKLLSYTREQVIGKTSLELNMVDPELRAILRQRAKENDYNLQDIEIDIRDAHGNIKHIISSTETIEIEGELHMLNTLVDFTERKQIEAEIIKSRKALNDAQKLSKTGSWEFNLQTQELFWSEEHYLIFEMEKTPADKLYAACRKKIHPDDVPNLDAAIKLANEKGEAAVYEHRITRSDGSIRHLLGLGEIIKDDKGNPAWLRGTTQDITERKEIEEKLRQNNIQLNLKNKELEQFAFIASHDLQEPLRTISSFTELFQEEYSQTLDENANTYVRFISQSANRMRDLISGLLEYSRLGNKRVLKQTDCNIVLKNVLANLHATIAENGAIIQANNLPVLKAYPLELELLFQNLLSNAIKFRKKEVAPEVRITTEKTISGWKFAFADNGIGIEEKHFEKIFLLFQRLHSRNSYEGSGIGLSHCKKIVELHNGTIWVESKAGVGSVFYFTIPEQPELQ